MEYSIRTKEEQEFIDISNIVKDEVEKTGVKDGIAIIFLPHTSAGITINEGADPHVETDIIRSLNKRFPVEDNYLHMEGNSHAHIKASIMGSSATVIIENGSLKLGRWQGIYYCEFDGPRNRKLFIKVMEG